MKKLLVLLAALSLVACSSKEPKEEVVEPTPTTTEAPEMQERYNAMEAKSTTAEEAPAVEETTTEEEAPAMEETTPAEEVPAVEEAPTEEEAETYTIQYGDNLYRIGLKYDMPWEKIAEANGISNPDVIIAGEELTIPAE